MRYEYDPDRPYPEHLKFGEYWQDPKMCGPNALFVLLKLNGISVTRDEVVKLVPVGPHGATLADLSQAATQLGLKHRLQKVSPQELRQLNPPVLVHENIRSMQPDQPDEGHFFVVVAFQEPDRVKVIDGVSGFYQQTDKERLSRSFSGYVLVPETRVAGISTRWLWGVLYAIVAVIAGLGVTLLIKSLRHGQRQKSGQLVQHA